MRPCLHAQQRQGMPQCGKTLLLILALLAFFIGVTARPVPANEQRADNAKQLNQLRQQIKRLQQELDKTRSQHDQVSSKLKEIETYIGKHVQELKHIRQRMSQQDRRLSQLTSEKGSLDQALSQQQRLLGRQVRLAYMMGQQPWIKLLLNQDQAAVAGRTMTYYRYFSESRSKQINDTTRALEQVNRIKLTIAQEQERLQGLKQEHRDKKQQLENASKNKSLVLAKLSTELKDQRQTLQRLRKDEKQLQHLLNTIQQVMPDELTIRQNQQQFSALKGQLNWPVAGKVEALFGHTRENTNIRWNGVVINAKEGRQVRAVSHGRVAYADWLRGYGLLLIIDHGHGYMSLYGHNQSLFKETGDWVEANEIIATVGNSGGQQHSGLYFEIRYQGKPTNPVHWCRKRRRA